MRLENLYTNYNPYNIGGKELKDRKAEGRGVEEVKSKEVTGFKAVLEEELNKNK